MTTLHDLVRRHGGELRCGGRAASIPGPGHSRRDRSLSLKLGEAGRVVFYSHAGDPTREVMAYLGVEGARASGRDARRARLVAEELKRAAAADRAFCAAVWAATLPLAGTPAEAYLASRRLAPPACPGLRFHPSAPRSKQPGAPTQPAMVALVSGHDGAPRGLHLTYLTPAGGKAFGDRSRLMFGEVAGGAVRLSPIRDGRLAVGEGIETCLAYGAITSAPVWAALSTSGLRSLRLPPQVGELTIAADTDANGAGLAAGAHLAERVRHRCRVAIDAPDAPPNTSADWADVWMRDPR